jgi:fatty-acyl-CoA synthase
VTVADQLVVPGAARLLDAMYESRPSAGPYLRVWNGGGFDELSWDDWRSRAERSVAGVRALGVERGKAVACVLTNSPAVCSGVIAVWLAGGMVASLPTPSRGMGLDTYLTQLRAIFRQLDADVLLMEESYAAAFPEEELEGITVASFESLLDSGPAEPDVAAADDVTFVQYSSGSTREPKGCLLQARAIEAQLDLLAEGLSLDAASEQGVMWLPLSHDMGLFGCLMLSFAKGMRLQVGAPERFLRAPATWFSDIAELQATITAAPNFALDLAARAARANPPAPSPMRKCVIGGERVEARTLVRAVDALRDRGLPATSLLPAYGMAEAVLAVTMARLEDEPRVISARSEALLEGELELDADLARADTPGFTQLVSCGPPLRGIELDVLGGTVGEICVGSPALAAGYAGDPVSTAERFVDGRVCTRDLGFMLDGELYVYGRTDDMIVFGGRNVWARDVEAAICAHAPVRPGSCALVDVHDGDRQRLVVVVEPAKGETEFGEIARAAKQAAYQIAGVGVHECVVVSPGTLPKTPSGKIQRFRCRSLTTSDDIEPLARVAA